MIFQNALLHNIAALLPAPSGEGLLLSRLPDALRTTLNERARRMAFCGCGAEIRFVINSGAVRVTLSREPDEFVDTYGPVEIYYGPFAASYMYSPRHIGPEPRTLDIVLPPSLDDLRELARQENAAFDPRVVRVLLPYDYPSRLYSIEGDIRPPEPAMLPPKTLLCYGSSITHGGGALANAGSWASLTAEALGMELVNLGLAGTCQLEPQMADYIAAQDFDMAVLELGVNVLQTFTPEEFARRARYLISTVAAAHPDTWIFCVDIFRLAGDFARNAPVETFREIIREIVRELNLPRLVRLRGDALLTDPLGLGSDLVHPSDRGMREIADNLVMTMREHIR